MAATWSITKKVQGSCMFAWKGKATIERLKNQQAGRRHSNVLPTDFLFISVFSEDILKQLFSVLHDLTTLNYDLINLTVVLVLIVKKYFTVKPMKPISPVGIYCKNIVNKSRMYIEDSHEEKHFINNIKNVSGLFTNIYFW